MSVQQESVWSAGGKPQMEPNASPGKACPTIDAVPSLCVLRNAMLVLHDELSALELDIGSALRNPRLALIAARWEKQRAAVAQFFDWEVYLDRGQVNS